MTLVAGSRLGPYEIISLLGSGGMGDVYRARDTRLQRDVAVKVLSPTLAHSADALARFEREAHSVAQLSHPNILAIHDVGRDGNVAYAVAELLEGETLRSRLAGGALPVRKAIDYALQIARGLAAAHDKGIVHRDLKPENVFITKDDRIKILDFGLARPSELPSANATMSVGAVTAAGTVLGTFGYMAPEQVRAQPLDHRADLFAFGTVLYEMVTGRQAFAGATPADTISAILSAEPPPLAAATGALPPALDRIVRRALEKKPELRFQSAHDLAFALETIGNTSVDAAASAIVPPAARVASPAPAPVARVAPWAIAAAALALAGWVAFRPAPPESSGVITRLDLGLPAGVELHVFGGTMAISPDGRQIALVGVDGGRRQAYIRALDQAVPRPLKGTETAFRLFFSPDGQKVGVIVTDGSIRIVTLATGAVAPLMERTDFFGAAWTSKDDILFTRDRKLWRVRVTGGVASVVPGAKDTELISYPFPLADGDHVLVTTTTEAGSDVAVVSLATGESRRLVSNAELPLYAESGHLLFLRGGMLVAARFNPATRELTGPEVPIMEGLPQVARASAISVAGNGTLVYLGVDALQSQIVWVSRSGAEQPLTRTMRQYSNPRTSPDGGSVLVQTMSGELWIHDGERDTLSRLATPVPMMAFPLWMSDRAVLYKSAQGVHRLEIAGGGHGHIAGTIPNDYPSGVSPDGGSLSLTRLSSESSADIYIASLTGAHAPRLWLKTPGYDGGGKWSPDGRLMVYSSTESGQNEVYLQAYPGPGIRRQVSVDGGSHPIWNRDGREIFYRRDASLFAVKVTRTGDDVSLSHPEQLFERLYGFGQGISIPNYDVSADGRAFAMVKDSGATRVNVVLNWFAELEAKTR